MIPPFPHASRARLAGLAVILGLVGGTAAEAVIKSRSELSAILARTPAPVIVAAGQELERAENIAAGIKDATAYLGVGESMEPLYASNTAVVIVPIAYDHIKKGMTVVYVNRDGFRVAHSVVGETGGGYLVQGVNNDEADADVVNENNLIGVIVQACSSAETGFRRRLSLPLMPRDRRIARKQAT